MSNIPTNNKNPLASEPKREKSGSDTYRKYNYQYHWAFCKMLDEHEKGNSYAIFVEEHEDVTLADSLDVNEARFEFNQVKEVGSKFTINKLKENSKSSSVLVKMAEGACNKSYSDKIKSVNLVSTGGFNFDLHKNGYNFEVINTGNLTEKEYGELRDHLISEFGNDDLLNCSMFVVPDLPAKGFDLVTKGKISSLINFLSPGSMFNPDIIYSCVIEDLQRKGESTFDYQLWDEALKKKAVTSSQLQEIINQNITRKNDARLQSELITILKDEFGLSSIKRTNIQKEFQRYYEKRVGDRNLFINKRAEKILNTINSVLDDCSDVLELVEKVKESISSEEMDSFNSDDEFIVTVLYEYIVASI